MGEFLVYTLKSGLLLTFLFAAYKLTLGKSKRFAMRRLALLSIYVCALLIPFADAFRATGNMSSLMEAAVDSSTVVVKVDQIGEYVTEEPAVYDDIFNILAVIMMSGIAVSLLLTVIGFLQILCYRIRSRKEMIDGIPVSVIKDAKLTPFTFGSTIYLSEKEYEEKDPMVLAHEYCHSHSLHYLDLILARLTNCIMWWNPFAWLMLRELHDVHEFQADEYVVSSGHEMKDYQMLLIRKAAGTRLQTFADSLNHSKLKTRLTMMKRSEKRGSLFRAALMIPAMVAGSFLLSTDTIASMLEPMRNVNISLTDSSVSGIPESDGKDSENSSQPQEIVIASQGHDAENGNMAVVDDAESESEAVALLKNIVKDEKKEEKGKDNGKDKMPAIRIDGKLMPEDFDMNSIDPSEIESITVFKDDPNKYPNGLIDITLKKEDKVEKDNSVSATDEPLKIVGYGTMMKSDMQGEEIPNVYITTNISNADGTEVTLMIVPGNGKEIKIDGAQLVVNGKNYDADSLSSSFSKSDDMAEQKIEIKLNKTLHKFDSKKDRIILQTSNGTLKIPLYNLK